MATTGISPPSRRHSYIPALDGVRALAISAVLLVHSFPDLTPSWRIGGFLNTIASVGPFGVDLFFVLSGFLITGILLDSTGSPHYFKHFYARRMLRLFPIYYCYLLLVMTLLPWLHRAIHTSMQDYSGSWWWYLTYFSNWKPNFAVGDPQLGHFWSLAIEEQFYIAWPAIVLVTKRRHLAWVCVALILSATILRCVWSVDGVYWNQIYRLTISRWDTIAMGAMAALALRSKRFQPVATRAAPRLLICGLGLFLVLAVWAGGPEWSRPLIQTFGACSAAIGFTGLVLYAATRETGALAGWLQRPLMVELGRYSYCIYVIHILVITHVYWLGSYVIKRFPAAAIAPAKLALFVLTNVMVFYLARLSWKYFESPILRLKSHFEDKR